MKTAIKKLDPVCFAYVMATGTLSTALHITGWTSLSLLFLFLAILGYLSISFLFICRVFFYPRQIMYDFVQVKTLFKCLTFSAGSNALAVRLALGDSLLGSKILAFLGVISTIILVYAIFSVLFFHEHTTIQAVSPFWLLMTIASHSSGIVLSTLWNHGILLQPAWLLGAFGFWTFGILCYIMLMTLNIYRMFFFPFEGKDLHPAYWTCMGAAAIAVFDGSQLIHLKHAPVFLETLQPFITGMVVLLWCWASAWIPILGLMGAWKYFYFKLPFLYHPALWAVIFPLGMYTLATDLLSKQMQLNFIQILVPVFLWITLLAWGLVAYIGRFIPWREGKDPSIL